MNQQLLEESWFRIPHLFTQCRNTKKLEHLVAGQSNTKKMYKVYEIAAPFVECKITNNDDIGGWHFKLYISPENMKFIESEVAKIPKHD